MRSPFHHEDFPLDRLIADKGATRVSVCLPAKNTAATVSAVVGAIAELRAAGVVDQLLVVDAASPDGTAEIAAAAGAEVVQESELHPELGPVLGKGDAMWRALEVLDGDVVCYFDTDSKAFDGHFARGLLGPLLAHPEIAFVKAAYRRPFTVDGVSVPEGGGRVSQLTARPLLTMFYPELAALRQPLSGEIAVRRTLLDQIPFATGYAVETAMLIDALEVAGPDAIAEVDLGERRNRHQSLAALTPMAWAVLQAVVARLQRSGRLRDVHAGQLLVPEGSGLRPVDVELVERPPHGRVAARAAAGGDGTPAQRRRA